MNEIIYGIHTVKALLRQDPKRFREVFIAKESKNKRLLSLIYELKIQKIAIRLTNRQFLDKQSKNSLHQGILVRLKSKCQYQDNNLLDIVNKLDNPFLLILDGITDPHNLGACLRSANAAGVHIVIVQKDRSALLNATAKKVACGASENILFIRVTNLVHTIRVLQESNIWILGTTSKADRTIYQSKMTKPIALIMGSEGKGIRHLILKHCNELISIPMLGSITSLNVSVATGICLFEAVRQRIDVNRNCFSTTGI